MRLALRELVGLFVDDGPFALTIVAWIVLALVLIRSFDSSTRGIVLFGGFALILIASVARYAGR
jgi:hypothetical protein